MWWYWGMELSHSYSFLFMVTFEGFQYQLRWVWVNCDSIIGKARLILGANHVVSNVPLVMVTWLCITDGSAYPLKLQNVTLIESNLPSVVTPLMWPEAPLNGTRQQYHQQQWHFDALHQPLWGREEDNQTFITPENSLMSYDSPANSGWFQNFFFFWFSSWANYIPPLTELTWLKNGPALSKWVTWLNMGLYWFDLYMHAKTSHIACKKINEKQ